MTTINKRTAVLAGPNMVQVDLDSNAAKSRYSKIIRLFEQHGRHFWKCSVYTESQTLNHVHVTLILYHKLPVIERLLLASILGDDPVRSLKNYCRVKNGAPAPILLFEKE